MDTTPNKYITVAYELYTDFDGKRELVEKAPIEHPFQFISDMGTTLEHKSNRYRKERNSTSHCP